MKLRIALISAWFVAFSGCASSDDCKPCVEKSSGAYRNSFDFVWESAREELKSEWEIESENRKTRSLTTKWKLNMSPFSSQGRRDRLVVSLAGDDAGGWRASAQQEAQTNANEENPLDESKAKWKAIANDGVMASKFLQNLDTRLQPDERWRERLAR